MLNPRALTHAQLAEIVDDVQAILWQESRMLPDFPREYGQCWRAAPPKFPAGFFIPPST